MTTAPERKLRSDAQRNRAHILDVAERHYAEHSITGSLDAIAKRAGVGAGTLYRHFPSRDALLAALLTARNEALATRTEVIRRDAAGSGEALAHWLEALGEWATAFDGLPDPLRIAVTEGNSPLSLTCGDTSGSLTSSWAPPSTPAPHVPRYEAGTCSWPSWPISWVSGAVLADEASGHGLSALLRAGWAVPEL